MNERVLIVDDNPDVLQSILRALRLEGIPCRGEIDPTKALEGFKADPTDVVIIDFVFDAIPGYTGLDVIAEIRKIKPVARTILISGRIDHDSLSKESLEAELKAKVQCDFYLPKSGSRELLISTVVGALKSAEERANDWQAIAGEYVVADRVKPEDVRQMNESVRANLIKALNEERGEE